MQDRDSFSASVGSSSGTLAPFAEARGVAVIGASADPSRVGGRVLIGLRDAGYRGAIHPVNPKGTEIADRQCYRRVEDVPDPVDLAIICTGAASVPEAIRACGRRGIAAAVVFADGFDEAMRAETEKALAEAKTACGLRMIGPNTVGVRTLANGLFATFAADLGTPQRGGRVAMIAQSGGLGVYIGSAQLMKRGLGPSHVIDTGGEWDVTAAECLDYIATRAEVSTIALLLEGARDGRALLEAVRRARANGKHVVFMKTGRSAKGEARIKSHTGALAGQSRLFENAMRAAGAMIVRDERELLDAMILADMGVVPKGRRIGIVTPSGGFGILVLDAAEEVALDVPEPAIPATVEEQAELAHGHFGNPLDFSSTISAGANAVETSLKWMARQPNIDAIILWQAYGAVREDRQALIRRVVSGARAVSDTPIFVCGLTTPAFEQELRQMGVLWFEEPTRLVRALAVAAPPTAPDETPKEAITTALDNAVVSGLEAVKTLADVQGLVQARACVVESAEHAAALLAGLGGRGVLKVEAPGNAHKTELGFVSGAIDAHSLSDAYRGLIEARRKAGIADAPIVLQALEQGVEMAIGAFRDSVFGPAVMVATGGIFLETIRDVELGLAPLAHEDARAMILKLKGASILRGARGKPPADIDALASALVGLSHFIAQHPEYEQIDINPIFVKPRGQGAVAVDAVLYRTQEKQQ